MRPVGLALAVLACYANSLSGPFLFDDLGMGNPAVFRTRPIVGLSFALNRALSSEAMWSWHLVNVLVHALAGSCLFGIVRRVLDRTRGEEHANANVSFAWTAALLWTLHPLQTESVSYISQRAESLAGLFTLGLVYGFVRAATSERGAGWSLFTLACFALGMATKEVVAVAPVLVLLLDRQLSGGGLRGVLARRKGFYAALLASWVVLFALFPGRPMLEAFGPVEADALVGLGVTFTPLEYLRTQPGVILHYLRLALWPHPLLLDHGWPAAQGAAEWLPQTLALLALGLGTLVALARRAWSGFLGAWFFVILAPTSSVVPLEDAAVEHRMYLPLAAVVIVALLVLERWSAKLAPSRAGLGTAAALALAGAAAAGTILRNQDYRSAQRMWSTVVAHAPRNPRGYQGLGLAEAEAGRPAEAATWFERVLAFDPTPTDYLNLGLACLHSGQLERALAAFRPIQGSLPPDSQPGRSLERALEELESHCRRACEHDPADAGAAERLGSALALLGKRAEALQAFEDAVRLAPERASAHTELALALLGAGEQAQAFEHFRRAVELRPDGAQEHCNVGRWLLGAGRFDEAAAHLRAAARLDPSLAQPRGVLARALVAKTGASEDETREAVRLANEAATLEPKNAEVLETLGNAHARLGEWALAEAAFERGLAAIPRWRTGPLRERLETRLREVRQKT